MSSGARGRGVRSRTLPLDRQQERRGFRELVDREREEAALRHAGRAVPGASHPLEEGRDRPASRPTWTARSTSPMSMPSSSDAVATSARSCPLLSRSSASRRRARDRLPWWHVTVSSPRRSASRAERRSAIFRVFTNTSVVRCSLHELGQACVDLVPLFVRADGSSGERGGLDGQVERAQVAGIDERRTRGRRRPGSRRRRTSGFCVALQPDALVAVRPEPPAARATARDESRACRAAARGSHRR